MPEHTPHPWVLRTFPTAAGGRPALWILDAIPDQDGKVVANAIAQVAMTNDDATANGHLLKAAPLLLAACEDVLGTIVLTEGLPAAIGRQSLDRLRAAIAKAKGADA
jgi:hypothetical protein